MGLTPRETNEDIVSNVEEAGVIVKEATNASFALLVSSSSSSSIDEVVVFDPTRLEADIAS